MTPNTPLEKELFLLIAEGNEKAYKQLFIIYVPLIGNLIFNIVKNQSDVDDLIQETMLRVWINRDQLPMINHPRAWILKIAYLLALSKYRRMKVHLKAIDQLASVNGLPGTSTNTENELSFRQTMALVSKAVQQLSPQQNKIYLLSREQGLKPREIAELLQLSEQTVKNTLVSALKSIRSYLQKYGYLTLYLYFCLQSK